MLSEIKNFLKIKSILVENFSISLKENEQILTEFCNCFLDVLKSNNLEIPEEKFDLIDYIQPKDNKYIIVVNTTQPKTIDVNFLLRKLFYKDLQLSIIEKIYKDLLNKLNNQIFIPYEKKPIKNTINIPKNNNVVDKIDKIIKDTSKKRNIYKFFYSRNFIKYFLDFNIYNNYDIRKGILDLYLLDKNFKLFLVQRNEEIVGFSVVWNNTTLKKPFFDKLYVKYEKLYDEVYNVFSHFLDKKNYPYKNRNNTTINNLPKDVEKIEYQIPEEIWGKIKWLPYMDTFKYCTNTGLLKNYDDKVYNYFLIDKEGTFIRENSNKTYWDNKIWKNNVWNNGTWKSGIWLKGTWENGEWQDGKWINGRWKNGTWQNGTWNNGIWYDGTWSNGIWKKGIWKKGIWNGGIWENGTWQNGIWNNGTWNNGVWKNGTWNNGTFKDGIWENGIWRNGKWYSGEWKNGVWERGEIYSKKFKKFIISEVSPDKFYELEKKYKTLIKFIKEIN